MKNLLLIGLLLGFCFSTSAQNSTITYSRPKAVILKTNPFFWVDPDPTVSVAAEWRTSPQKSLQTEVGYSVFGQLQNTSDLQHNGTWRLKTELRFYTNRYRKNRKKNIFLATEYPLGNYRAFEAFVKLLDATETWQSLPPTGPNGTGPFHTQINRNSLSLTYKFGRQIAMAPTNQQGQMRLLLDMFVGVGMRLINTTYSGDDRSKKGCGCVIRSGINYDRFAQKGIQLSPNVSAGVRLGFAL